MLHAGYSIPEEGVVQYEMGYRADEFSNVLNGPFSSPKSGYRCETVSKHHWCINRIDNSFQIGVQVFEKPPRKLGLFALPVLRVQFKLQDGDTDQQTKFFDRFFKYFHKGGG